MDTRYGVWQGARMVIVCSAEVEHELLQACTPYSVPAQAGQAEGASTPSSDGLATWELRAWCLLGLGGR
jgi:hypothetical protein